MQIASLHVYGSLLPPLLQEPVVTGDYWISPFSAVILGQNTAVKVHCIINVVSHLPQILKLRLPKFTDMQILKTAFKKFHNPSSLPSKNGIIDIGSVSRADGGLGT
jgi:hypothetical protein